MDKKPKYTFLKIILTIAICIVILFILGIVLFIKIIMSGIPSYKPNQIGLLETYYNENLECAFASTYMWNGSESTKNITIPDKSNDYDITCLGGFIGRGVPCSFDINFPYSYDGKTPLVCDEKPSDNNTYYISFTLNIGKNIKEIKKVYMNYSHPYKNDDGSIIFYQPTVYINCDEANEVFYSKDGKLYYKESNLLVDAFKYSE